MNQKDGTKTVKLVKINVFTIRPKRPLCPGFVLKLMEKQHNNGNKPHKNIYNIENNVLLGGSSLYYFEMNKNVYGFYDISIHIASRSRHYRDVKSMLKKEPIIKELRKCAGSDFNVEFGRQEMSWVKWQKVPLMSLIEYFNRKGEPLKFSA